MEASLIHTFSDCPLKIAETESVATIYRVIVRLIPRFMSPCTPNGLNYVNILSVFISQLVPISEVQKKRSRSNFTYAIFTLI